MRVNRRILICLIVDQPDRALLVLLEAGHDRCVVRADRAQTLGINVSIYSVDESQVRKVVHINALLKHHDDFVFAQLHILNRALVAELTYALLLVVVPEQDFVVGEFWMRTASH